jgi:hypothetical protein
MLIQRLLTLTFVLGFVLSAARADTMTFSSSSSFLAQLGAHITDDYSAPGYVNNGTGNTSVLTDAQMSVVIGETTYHSTGFPDFNLVSAAGTSSATYCTGCNGSFQLGFTSTTVGDSNGVFGVGFDVVFVSPMEYAFVTFGDSSTANYLLTFPGFFGITSTLEIKSIDVGLINGGTTTSNFAEIDNLTIGAPAVPEPAGWLLLATVSGLVGLLRLSGARRASR